LFIDVKLELIKGIIEDNRKQTEPFLQSFGLDWDALTRFAVEQGLAEKHTIYQPESAGISALAHPFYRTVRKCKNTPIHDLGCGLGINARYFVFDEFSEVSASDIDPQKIEAGYLLFGDRMRSKIKFATADARKLTSVYGRGAFGILYGGFVLHQLKTLEDAKQALNECGKSLHHSGVHFGMTRGTCKQGTAYELVQVSEHKTRLLISPSTLEDLLQKTGHSSIQMSTINIDPDLKEIVVYYSARTK
jgi:SAM-dependent methyltransferase